MSNTLTSLILMLDLPIASTCLVSFLLNDVLDVCPFKKFSCLLNAFLISSFDVLFNLAPFLFSCPWWGVDGYAAKYLFIKSYIVIASSNECLVDVNLPIFSKSTALYTSGNILSAVGSAFLLNILIILNI